jgi:hypothetical protein
MPDTPSQEIFLISCTRLKKEMLVSTGEVTNILTNSADASGQVIDLGDGAIQYGHCFAKTPNVALVKRF